MMYSNLDTWRTLKRLGVLVAALVALACGQARGVAEDIDLATMKGVQQALAALGYNPGGIDGAIGPKTLAALNDFFDARGAGVSISSVSDLQRALAAEGHDPGAVDGQIGPKTLRALAPILAEALDAKGIKYKGGANSSDASTLGPGDHVWYYNGMISRSTDIPRLTWFRDASKTDATDYQGHGDEIFNFVIHANGEIRRGRPHMRRREGSYAWLNNNPGNITGVKGGQNYGQYPDKFNWHNFLIFPSYEAGYDGIAKYLRNARNRDGSFKYRDQSILSAFKIYAPASDGNDPVSYANSVAAAAGVSPGTLIRDLSDEQMKIMQDKIVEIEGYKEGVTLSPDSPELPDAIRAQLGGRGRNREPLVIPICQ